MLPRISTARLWPLALALPLLAGCPAALTHEHAAVSASEIHALEADPEVLLSSIAVIGASASAGFGLESRPLLEHPDLAHYLRQAIQLEDSDVALLADDLFFLSPREAAERQLSSGEAELWVAVDFLFWFAYGAHEESQRFKLFEEGLELLELIEEPLLIGDLPHMLDADPSMLAPTWIPEPATLRRLNDRLQQWAAETPTRLVVPLAEWAERQRASGEAIELRGLEWSAEEKGRLLQADGLHPSREGTAALALLAMDKLFRSLSTPPTDGALVQWSAPAE